MARLLFEHFPRLTEGELSRIRASLVRQQALAEIAGQLQLGEYLMLGEGELKSGGFRRPSILADAVEAILGAIMLDRGFDAAFAVIAHLYHPMLSALDPNAVSKDPKTRLQEWLQGRRYQLPMYTLLQVQGEAHDQQFEVECQIPELKLAAKGLGSSRRTAEQDSAQQVYEMIMKQQRRKP
ncbi:ribonuclease-3 [Chitinivorax tropicus]|uniref:Ribonuclease III n=1 Tax=Chitinivorax tropicus TaxID=714531 RepID=A0A840MYD2_9PROT|nr:ribonuclease-3 [Chitinivorax tropicus]